MLLASLFLFGFGGGFAEKGAVIAVEAGVVPKAHGLANRGGGVSVGEHLLREQQAFAHDILLRCLVHFALEAPKEIAFADEEMPRHLPDPAERGKGVVDIPQGVCYEGGTEFAPFSALSSASV